MNQIVAGSPISLTFYFVSSGSLVDPTGPAGKVYNPSGSLVYTLSGLTSSTTGIWTEAVSTATTWTVGTHRAYAYGTYNSDTLYCTSPIVFDVISSPDVLYYCSVPDVKAYLGIASTDYSNDSLLRTFVAAATNFIETYTRRAFKVQYATDYFDLSNDREVILKNYPIVSISALTVAGVAISDYRLENMPGRITFTDYSSYYERYGTYYDWVGKTGLMICTYAYGDSKVPDNVHLACMKVGSFLYNAKTKEGIRSEHLLSYSYTLEKMQAGTGGRSGGFLSEVGDLLADYRLVHV
jgi:hypothetical protein